MAFPAKLGLLLVSAVCAHAQLVVSARAGLIDYVQGNVSLNGERLKAGSAIHQMQPAQTLTTGRGRVEVLLAPGIMMRLGDESSIRIEDTRLEDTQVAIEKGSLFIEVVEAGKDSRLRVFLSGTETELHRNGLYRFDFSPARVRVYGGEASVLRAGAPVLAKRGQAVDLKALDLSAFELQTTDGLHLWSAQRSFSLFNSNLENRRKQKHWEYIGDGWLWNNNYKIKYRSAQARRDNAWVEQELRRPNPSVHRAESQD